VSDAIDTRSGRLGGAKTFRYLVIPDSARTAGLPTLVYSYFDPVSRSYASAQAPPVSYLVAPAREVAVSRASPAALQLDRRPPAASRLLDGLPPGLALTLLLVPPLLVLFPRRSLKRTRRAPAGSRRIDPVAQAEEELSRTLAGLVPRLPDFEGEKLESALRSVGVETETARRAVEVRERVRAARYGPAGNPDRKAVLSEAREMIERLAPAGAGERTRRVLTGVLLLAVVGPVSGQAQTMSPELLYEKGALNSAATVFAERARLEPGVPAHWFNLRASRFRMGAAGQALAAWTRAERLAPRDPSIRRSLRLVPVPDDRSARALWVSPVTPEELLVAAGVLWIAGWIGFAFTRQNRWLAVVIGGLLSAGGAGGLSLWYRRPLGIVTADNALALSPHELAPAVVAVQVGSVVTVLQRQPGWTMVREMGGKIGWLPLASVEEL
jgi:hypothetical protein